MSLFAMLMLYIHQTDLACHEEQKMTRLFEIIKEKQAFLWDFDGCFCDSEQVHFVAYSKAFAHFGHTVDQQEYFHTFTHTGQGAAKEIEKYDLKCTPDDIKNLKDKYYWELILQGKAHVFAQVPQIVSLLKRRGIKSVIASNSRAQEINLILSQMSEKADIDAVIGIEPGMKKKPAPDIFNKAMAHLGISAKHALVVEDSERGLIAGQRAGCDAIWIKTNLTERFESSVPYVAKISHAELLSVLLQNQQKA